MAELWSMEGGGTLSLREEGLQVRLEAVRPSEGQGLYKAWLRGQNGRFFLGTLLPEPGRLRLIKRVSRSSLERAGCWPVVGGVIERYSVSESGGDPGGWLPAAEPERLCRDPLVRESLRGQLGFCVKRGEEGAMLSAPYRPSQPFPLPLLFCFARLEMRGGRPWLVWTFDWEGNPIFSRIGQDGTGHTEQAEKSPEESVL
mgnify:FL=1